MQSNDDNVLILGISVYAVFDWRILTMILALINAPQVTAEHSTTTFPNAIF